MHHARQTAQQSRQSQKEKASDNSYHKILTADLFNMPMEYNRRLCYSCIKNSSYIKKENDHAGNQRSGIYRHASSAAG